MWFDSCEASRRKRDPDLQKAGWEESDFGASEYNLACRKKTPECPDSDFDWSQLKEEVDSGAAEWKRLGEKVIQNVRRVPHETSWIEFCRVSWKLFDAILKNTVQERTDSLIPRNAARTVSEESCEKLKLKRKEM